MLTKHSASQQRIVFKIQIIVETARVETHNTEESTTWDGHIAKNNRNPLNAMQVLKLNPKQHVFIYENQLQGQFFF